MATKSDKAKLDKNAEKIRKMEKAKAKDAPKPKPEPLVIPESKRDIREIVRERVTVLEGSIGVKLAEETPIEEVLRIMDWAQAMNNHVGFMIGDIINFGKAKWGDKYEQAMEQTGRAYSTLAHYAMVSRKIPADKRVSALTFTHHEAILRIGDDSKAAKVLNEVGEQAEKGKLPTTKELRDKITKHTVRKLKKGPKRATSGKGKKKGKQAVEAPPYKPTDAEQEKLDEAEIAMEEASKLIGKMLPIVGRLTTKDKKRWLEMAEPFVTFYNALDRITGY